MFPHVNDHRFQGVERFLNGRTWRNEQLFLDDPFSMRKIHGKYPEFARNCIGQRNINRIGAYDLAYVGCNRAQQVPKFKIRGNSIRQVEKQLHLIILMLRAPEIQTIIKRERNHTPDQPQEAYFFLAEWIHCVTVDSENTHSTMRSRQRYTEPRPEAHFLCPFFISRVPLFRVPIGGMLWVTTTHSIPQGQQLLYRQV